MQIIIAGGGKVGYYLTKTLLEHGHKPHLIEKNKDLCISLANDLDIPIFCGDGSAIDVLESADTAHADALISVTGLDEDNLIICQLAKSKFNVPKTVARVNNPKNAEVMKQLGVDIPISSTDNIARLLEREIDTASIKRLMQINRGEASISELIVPANYAHHGIRLSQMQVPMEIVIVSITRGTEFIIPRGNTQVFSGDKIIVVAKNKALHELSKMLNLDEK